MACTTSHIVLDVLYRTGCAVVAVHMLTSMFKKSHIQFFFFKCTRWFVAKLICCLSIWGLNQIFFHYPTTAIRLLTAFFESWLDQIFIIQFKPFQILATNIFNHAAIALILFVIFLASAHDRIASGELCGAVKLASKWTCPSCSKLLCQRLNLTAHFF